MKTKSEVSPLRISPVFGPKLGEDQKKGLHLNLGPKVGEHQKIKIKKQIFIQIISLSYAQTFCSSYKEGGHTAILHTILC